MLVERIEREIKVEMDKGYNEIYSIRIPYNELNDDEIEDLNNAYLIRTIRYKGYLPYVLYNEETKEHFLEVLYMG